MANQKLTALTALASLSADDLFYVVDDPAGAALSRKMTASVLDARYLQVANNLSDLASRQTALDTLTNVAAATNEHVLTRDTATGNAIFKAAPATGAPVGATYIVQTPDGTLTNEQALSSLATGLLKNTTGTGVLSIAAEGTDYFNPPFLDTNALVKGSADATKLLRFEVDGFSAGATRVMTPPNQDTTLAGQNFANIFSVAQTIQGSADAVQLAVRAHSTQTSSLMEWRKSDNVVLGKVMSLVPNGVNAVRLFLPGGDAFARFALMDAAFNNYYFYFDGNGAMNWGAGTAASGDVKLQRTSGGMVLQKSGISPVLTSATLTISSVASQTAAALILNNSGLASGAPNLRLIPHASQTVDMTAWEDTGGVQRSRINKDGYFMTKKIAAPADGDLNTSEMALWLDDTAGACKLMVKAKNASGTVVTGNVALV